MEDQSLIDIATRFRAAIQSVMPELRPIGMKAFPRGSCGDASLLLGAYLADAGIEGFKYVCGERGSHENHTWTTHAWLQRGACVIDITADQFSDAPSAVVVAEPSTWHNSFAVDHPQQSDFRSWTGYGAELLHPMYARVLEALAALASDSTYLSGMRSQLSGLDVAPWDVHHT